ncbi:phosphomevalonate kinase [Streptococcus pseudoporcinus]|uniref:phosphomevalonate kinase n=1 Tax=Streptococcus pseudoporcinus TaxID=361101 RepID=A0A4U9XMJ3_9STRE|nr:phosphomevalonate kinase [Streptococcus pseudoporcinus]VTS13975.1 phosphomevalonate kinase [Streptococcus pseudoporcinus]VUC66914.1 phosphomevalonate kinase [Streptococcus pseudoporcinus]VUC97842.1 phosphomevalonate kinase [Streptococcus pseudoporcinus]VUC98234.1 phosphomevalonate kinase [Streptococcus pseudoporcinus]
MTKYQVETGGKLYIAGEYAILSPGQTAILMPIPIKMKADIEAARHFKITSDMFDYSVGLEPNVGYQLIQASIHTVSLLLGKETKDLPPFHLRISGKMEAEGKKYGLGSSGSVTVLTIKALAKFFHLSLSNDLLFKLAAYTLLTLGDNGSMGDIACIAYDRMIAYKSFDRQAISKRIHDYSFEKVMKEDWQYQIDVIEPQLDTHFLVGWTKVPSISRDMINRVKDAIDASFLAETQKAVLDCQKGLESGDKDLFVLSLAQVSDLLQELDPAIYHPKLLALKEACQGLNAVAKSSGSGGGDCGIAFSFDQASTDRILTNWQTNGIDLIYDKRWLADD